MEPAMRPRENEEKNTEPNPGTRLSPEAVQFLRGWEGQVMQKKDKKEKRRWRSTRKEGG